MAILSVKLNLSNGIWQKVGSFSSIAQKDPSSILEIVCADSLPVGDVPEASICIQTMELLRNAPAAGSWYVRVQGGGKGSLKCTSECLPGSLRIADADASYYYNIAKTLNGKLYSSKNGILISVYDADFNVLHSFDKGVYDRCNLSNITSVNDYFIVSKYNTDYISGEIALYDQSDYSFISSIIINGIASRHTSNLDKLYFTVRSKPVDTWYYVLYEASINGTVLNTYDPTAWGFPITAEILNKVSDGTYLYVFICDGVDLILLKLAIDDLSIEVDRSSVFSNACTIYNMMITLDGNNLYFGTPSEEYKAYILDITTMTITYTFENPMDGEIVNEGFGSTVQVTDDYIFIGANLHGNWGAEMGGKVFVYDKTTKELLYKVQSDNLKPNIAGFGVNIVTDDTYLYVCSPGENSGSLHRFLLTDIIAGHEYYTALDAVTI